MASLSGCRLPPGSLLQQKNREFTTKDFEDSALEQFAGKIKKIESKYTETKDLVAFSERVQKIKSLFTTLAGFSKHQNGISESQQWTIATQNTVGESLQKISTFFIDEVRKQEDLAVTALGDRRYADAAAGFSVLLKALAYEKGSERYFFIQGYALTTLARQEKVQEAITLLLELEKSPAPGQNVTLGNWLGGIRTDLTTYITHQVSLNEEAFKQSKDQIIRKSSEINSILSKEQLAKDNSLQSYLGQLGPIREVLDQIADNLKTYCQTGKTLASYSKQLGIDYKSSAQEVVDLHTEWSNLVRGAISLLQNLNDCATDQEKNQILCPWIAEHISAYQIKEVSALHIWALSLLGKLFMSTALKNNDLDESIRLGRTHASSLVRHFAAFPSDVLFTFGSQSTEISLLLLGIISVGIDQTYCSEQTIQGLQPTWNFTKLAKSLMGSASKESDKPKIDFTEQIKKGVAPFIYLETIITILNELLIAFKQNKFENLKKLTTEEKVALFEIACDLLGMPPAIMDLSIKSVNTTDFQKNLTALQWLRLVQATRTPFHYSSLERLFPALSKEEFLKWISLYKSDKITIDPKNHHRLFFALMTRAEVLCADRNTFSDEEIAKIFTFFAKRYAELVQLDLDAAVKHKLDAKLIQFGARCVARAKDSSPYENVAVVKSITHLNTQLLKEIEDLLEQPPVRRWFENCIYPTIQELTLHKPLTQAALDHYSYCTGVQALTMPGNVAIHEWEWRTLHERFRNLQSLSIGEGTLDIAQLDALPLQSLTLKNLSGSIDFSRCQMLQRSLEKLTISKAKVVKNSLSWVVASEKLKSLTIENPLDAIGSLAREELPHGLPKLTTLSLKNVFMDSHVSLISSLERVTDQQLHVALENSLNNKLEDFLRSLTEEDLRSYLQTLFGQEFDAERRALDQDLLDQIRNKEPYDLVKAFRRLTAQKLIAEQFPEQELIAFVRILTGAKELAGAKELVAKPTDIALTALLEDYSTELVVDALGKLRDPELIASLPKLIASQSTIAAITVQSGCQQSILQKLEQATSVKELTVQWNEGENLSLLSQFPHLETVTFFTNDAHLPQLLQQHDFSSCSKLVECWLTNSAGMRFSIPVQR